MKPRRGKGKVRPENGRMLDKELLEILACPETREAVSVAPEAVVQALNERIARGEVKNRGGETVTERLDMALVRKDGRFAYPVRDGIPIMLVEEAIPL